MKSEKNLTLMKKCELDWLYVSESAFRIALSGRTEFIQGRDRDRGSQSFRISLSGSPGTNFYEFAQTDFYHI